MATSRALTTMKATLHALSHAEQLDCVGVAAAKELLAIVVDGAAYGRVAVDRA